MTAPVTPPPPPLAPVDREALAAWGRALGAALRAPAVVALRGDVGAGKTTLAQAVCAGYGVTDDVTSPTFALVHEYAAPRGVVRHIDLYRLRDRRELDALGWDELTAAGDALVLVEWPERAGAALPAARLDVALAIAPGDPGRRVVTLG